jgi:hypothetical protein
MKRISCPVYRSLAGSTHRVPAMLHQSIFRSADRMDQYVGLTDFRYIMSALIPLHASRMSLQSALIGFLLSRLLPTPLTAQEIIVVQTTAVATGTVRFR